MDNFPEIYYKLLFIHMSALFKSVSNESDLKRLTLRSHVFKSKFTNLYFSPLKFFAAFTFISRSIDMFFFVSSKH